MGKKRIQIKKIEDPHAQTTTFSRRRNGLLKKAYELSVLCGVDITVLIFDTKNKCHVYCSNTSEDAAQAMMQKYISKRFKTNTLKGQNSEKLTLNSHGWYDTQENVSVIDTYQVVSSASKENDGSQTYTSLEETVDDTDGAESLCIRSKRTYHVYMPSSDTSDTQTFLTSYQDSANVCNRDNIVINSNCFNPSVLSERTYPYSNNSYGLTRSISDFRLSTNSQNFYQNTAFLTQNGTADDINQIHKYTSIQPCYDSYFYDNSCILEKCNNQTLNQLKMENCIDSDILSSVIEDYIPSDNVQKQYEEVAEDSLDNKIDCSPSKILLDFQNYLYL
ncbi:hypothetical protein PMAC_003261 [Pneumocystis sp. 'macacae']|nr:hypothetical protein PMAC_003261 [Pneumocystis sp. 'macacae']